MNDQHMEPDLAPLPEDWSRALAIVAHPDDMEYGAASAVARWTGQGKDVRYLLVTRGEAGISSRPPSEVIALRHDEQRASCAAVGVESLEFLSYPDGLVEANLALRADLAGAIRRHQPEVVISINYRTSWGGASWNHSDHRAVGIATLDSVRDAGNRWLFPDSGEPWEGVRFVAFNSSPEATHGVDVTDTIDAGLESLLCHRSYLEGLDGETSDVGSWLRRGAESNGPRLGVPLATTFEVIEM